MIYKNFSTFFPNIKEGKKRTASQYIIVNSDEYISSSDSVVGHAICRGVSPNTIPHDNDYKPTSSGQVDSDYHIRQLCTK